MGFKEAPPRFVDDCPVEEEFSAFEPVFSSFSNTCTNSILMQNQYIYPSHTTPATQHHYQTAQTPSLLNVNSGQLHRQRKRKRTTIDGIHCTNNNNQQKATTTTTTTTKVFGDTLVKLERMDNSFDRYRQHGFTSSSSEPTTTEFSSHFPFY